MSVESDEQILNTLWAPGRLECCILVSVLQMTAGNNIYLIPIRCPFLNVYLLPPFLIFLFFSFFICSSYLSLSFLHLLDVHIFRQPLPSAVLVLPHIYLLRRFFCIFYASFRCTSCVHSSHPILATGEHIPPTQCILIMEEYIYIFPHPGNGAFCLPNVTKEQTGCCTHATYKREDQNVSSTE
jgi:hypothetical protein